MDNSISSSTARGSRAASHDRHSGFPTHGIWAALSNPSHPFAAPHMSKGRSFHCFGRSPDGEQLDYADRSSSLHATELLPPSSSRAAAAPSSPIEATPGYQYQHYWMHEQEVDADRSCDSKRYGQSAPMDVLRPPPAQWRSCRRKPQREGKGRRRHRGEADEEKEQDNVRTSTGGTCRGWYGGDGESEGAEEEEEEVVEEEEEKEKEEEEERLPPHQLLEREWAAATNRGGAAFSLCQGIGRTLKGRDLCRVRNAILKHTGFI